jgi:hypothetical protein
MSDSRTVMAWPDNEWPDWPATQPTTGAESYGGIVGQIPPPDSGPPDVEDPQGIDNPPGIDQPPGDDREQPDTGEPRLDFPGDNLDAPPEVKLQGPDAA